MSNQAQQRALTTLAKYKDILLNGSAVQKAQAIKNIANSITAIDSFYGGASSELAAQLVLDSLGGDIKTAVSDRIEYEQILRNLKYAASHVYKAGATDEDFDAFASIVRGHVNEYMTKRAFSSIKVNSEIYQHSTGNRVKYMRVPMGDETCAFCIMLASRGPAYSADTVLSHIHDGCDCEAVPTLTGEIEGYSYTPYRAMWDDAVEKAKEEWGDEEFFYDYDGPKRNGYSITVGTRIALSKLRKMQMVS